MNRHENPDKAPLDTTIGTPVVSRVKLTQEQELASQETQYCWQNTKSSAASYGDEHGPFIVYNKYVFRPQPSKV